MNLLLKTTLIVSITSNLLANNSKTPGLNKISESNALSFTENRGQIHDQNHKTRQDVLYGVMAGNMAVHIKRSGVSYQLYKVDSWKEVEDVKTNKKRKEIETQTIYRVDLNWINANKDITKSYDETLPGFNNYYLESCPDGALNVKSYKGVTIGNLYNGIDLHYYEKDGELKHDYIVAPHSDYKQIQLHVEGADIKPNTDGTLLFVTPLGKIQEGAPIVYQNGKQLKAKWILNKNNLSFDIENYDSSLELIIDPITRIWGTYYGGTGVDVGYSTFPDAAGNIYLTGYSNSSSQIATVGAHQTTVSGGYDAFLVKFNSTGARQWGTYYGGTGNDYGAFGNIDVFGDIYMGGSTSSTIGISTPGSHQATFGGGSSDAFIVKFNPTGNRLWGTYYGGGGTDFGNSCSFDASGNLYIAGATSSNSGTTIATTGAYQSTYGGGTYDAFIVKFNNAGLRQWGTYFGGSLSDHGSFCSTDLSGNIYLTGSTESSNNIATIGTHQNTYGGGTNDAYLVKFNNNGVMQWGTYYGGSGIDYGFACSVDSNGNIFIAGHTSSNTGTVIATAGSHQGSHGGGTYDGFVAKLNNMGMRQWGTYYGGTGGENVYGCCTDPQDNVYIAGFTSSNSGTIIATTGSHQSIYGGGTEDAFVTKFSNTGIRKWGTYYGGSLEDFSYFCSSDGAGNVYLSGETLSNNGTSIASVGAYQTTMAGGLNEGLLAKLYDCTPANPTNASLVSNQNICAGNNTTLSANSGTSTINWYASPSSTAILGTGITFTTPVLTAGTYTYYSEANGCVISDSRTAITVTVNPTPTIIVNSGSICTGDSFTISPSGANTYTIQGGNAIVSPTTTVSYTVVGTSTAGCVSSSPATSNVTVNPLPIIGASTSNTILCIGQSATLTASGASTYTFSPGGTAASIVVSPTVTSTYTISGTSAQGCNNSSVFTQSVSSCAGISQISNSISEINVYPSPFSSKITILSNGTKQTMQIFNTLGSLIYKAEIENEKTEIDLEKESSGIYFVKVGRDIKKIVKE